MLCFDCNGAISSRSNTSDLPREWLARVNSRYPSHCVRVAAGAPPSNPSAQALSYPSLAHGWLGQDKRTRKHVTHTCVTTRPQ